MPHIHTRHGEHDATASAFVFRVDGPEPRILLHTHKKLGVLLQFGGHVELTETPWQAVTHELLEESGYELSQCQLLQPKLRMKKLTGVVLHPVPFSEYTHRFKEGHYHSDRAYIFITREDPRHAPVEGESQDVRGYTRAELLALDDTVIALNVREIALVVIDELLSSEQWEAVDPQQFAL